MLGYLNRTFVDLLMWEFCDGTDRPTHTPTNKQTLRIVNRIGLRADLVKKKEVRRKEMGDILQLIFLYHLQLDILVDLFPHE